MRIRDTFQPHLEYRPSYAQGGISIGTLHECVAKIKFDLSQVQSPFQDVISEEKKSRLRVVN